MSGVVRIDPAATAGQPQLVEGPALTRTNTVFDGVIDFDATVRDPVTLTNFQTIFHPGLNANDWLHLNPLGYKAMGDAIDLNLFTQ